LRKSAREATNIGGKLNSLALEIQVHNLEAQRKVGSYLREAGKLGPEKARQMYLEEADFEVSEMGSLAERAMKISPTAEQRAKFQKITASLAEYDKARQAAVRNSESGVSGPAAEQAMSAYMAAGDRLHDNAEDGEAAGREASEKAQEDIERTSKRASAMSIGISLLGLVLALVASVALKRAILIPIDHLKDVAENVSLGNLDVAVQRHRDDEVGDLADSFSRMVTAVKFFRMEAMEAESSGRAGDSV
jgi:methyl-accepting chemotaxis protein